MSNNDFFNHPTLSDEEFAERLLAYYAPMTAREVAALLRDRANELETAAARRAQTQEDESKGVPNE
jgi:hypothetical protein